MPRHLIGTVGLVAMVLSFACTGGEAPSAAGTMPTPLEAATQRPENLLATMTPAEVAAQTPRTPTATPDRTATSQGQRVTVSGVLDVMWGDPPPDSGRPGRMQYILTDTQGQKWTLVFHRNLYWPSGGPSAFNRKHVMVEGELTADGETLRILVDSIQLE